MDIMPAMEESRAEAFVAKDSSVVLHPVSEFHRKLRCSAVRDRSKEINPFKKSFNSDKGQSACANSLSGTTFNILAFCGQTPWPVLSPSTFCSPGGAQSLSPVDMTSPTPTLQELMPMSNSGQSVFMRLRQEAVAEPMELTLAGPGAEPTGVNAHPPSNSVTSTSPPDASPLPVAIVEPLPRASVTPVLENSVTGTTATMVSQRKVEEYLEAMDSISILSEMSSLTGYTGSGQSTLQSNRSTASRKTRPILETDDPLLAEKRHRNRIAAEKCRKGRKQRLVALEVSHQEQGNRYKELKEKFTALTASSKARIDQLTEENNAFKQENILLRIRLGASLSLRQQQPAPLPFPSGTVFAVDANGQRIELQLFQQPASMAMHNGQPASASFLSQ